MDPAQDICSGLDMPYFGTELFAIITADTGNHSVVYTVYATHSGSGHKTSGLAINAMQRDWTFVQADIKMKSHDHQLDYDTETVLTFSTNNVAVVEQLQHLVLTGSTLARPGSYATKKPHKPTRLGFMPVIMNMRNVRRERPSAWTVRPCYELAEG
jgi:hypothetical protein